MRGTQVAAARRGLLYRTTRLPNEILRRLSQKVTQKTAAKTAAAVDPIQRLFVEKIHEYAEKSKASGGGMVEGGPEWDAMLKAEQAKLKTIYGDQFGEASATPSFEFKEPVFDDVLPKWEMPEKFERPEVKAA